MVSFNFYVQGLVMYVPAAALLAYILAILVVQREKKRLKDKKKCEVYENEVRKNNKTGFCECCKVFITGENEYQAHITKNKHKESAKGFSGKWLSIPNDRIKSN
jgi:hypothetical protein